MGGASVILAIIVVLLMRRTQENNKTNVAIAKINLLPVAFGSSLGFSAGLPVILNPLFVLPSVIIPLVNMALAGLAISLHMIPVCVYPILKGTPGVLLSFFGTNGNWGTLWFTIALFVLDVCIMWPIMKINEQVEEMLKAGKGSQF